MKYWYYIQNQISYQKQGRITYPIYLKLQIEKDIVLQVTHLVNTN